MQFFTQYDNKPPRFDQTFKEPSMTKQSFAGECDVNNIMAKYVQTGIPPELRSSGIYGDFSSLPDYQQAQNIMVQASEQFENLPSHIRERFQNDPEKMIEFCSDEKNRDELIKLGMIDAPITLPGGQNLPSDKPKEQTL